MTTQTRTAADANVGDTITIDTFKGEATGRVLYAHNVAPNLYGGNAHRSLTLIFPNNRTWHVEVPNAHPVTVEVPEAPARGWTCRCDGCIYGD